MRSGVSGGALISPGVPAGVFAASRPNNLRKTLMGLLRQHFSIAFESSFEELNTLPSAYSMLHQIFFVCNARAAFGAGSGAVPRHRRANYRGHVRTTIAAPPGGFRKPHLILAVQAAIVKPQRH